MKPGRNYSLGIHYCIPMSTVSIVKSGESGAVMNNNEYPM